jgi:hypothetical protein
MGQLTGFTSLKGKERTNAERAHTIGQGQSPFQQDVTFSVTDYDFQVANIDGKPKEDGNKCPVLVTSVGSLFLSLLTKKKVTADGTILEPDGTFNRLVRELIIANRTKTNGEILKAIVDACKDKTVSVLRTPYVRKTSFGEQPAELIEFNIQ